MNYEEAKIIAKKRYERALDEIELSNKVYNRIKSLLPKGWACNIEDGIFGLEIQKGSWSDEKRVDAMEFKLMCKVVEKVIGQKMNRDALVINGTDEIRYLKADKYYSEDGVCIGISIFLFYPKNMPDCRIEWKDVLTKEAVVSDECLGLS